MPKSKTKRKHSEIAAEELSVEPGSEIEKTSDGEDQAKKKGKKDLAGSSDPKDKSLQKDKDRKEHSKKKDSKAEKQESKDSGEMDLSKDDIDFSQYTNTELSNIVNQNIFEPGLKTLLQNILQSVKKIRSSEPALFTLLLGPKYYTSISEKSLLYRALKEQKWEVVDILLQTLIEFLSKSEKFKKLSTKDLMQFIAILVVETELSDDIIEAFFDKCLDKHQIDFKEVINLKFEKVNDGALDFLLALDREDPRFSLQRIMAVLKRTSAEIPIELFNKCFECREVFGMEKNKLHNLILFDRMITMASATLREQLPKMFYDANVEGSLIQLLFTKGLNFRGLSEEEQMVIYLTYDLLNEYQDLCKRMQERDPRALEKLAKNPILILLNTTCFDAKSMDLLDYIIDNQPIFLNRTSSREAFLKLVGMVSDSQCPDLHREIQRPQLMELIKKFALRLRFFEGAEEVHGASWCRFFESMLKANTADLALFLKATDNLDFVHYVMNTPKLFIICCLAFLNLITANFPKEDEECPFTEPMGMIIEAVCARGVDESEILKNL